MQLDSMVVLNGLMLYRHGGHRMCLVKQVARENQEVKNEKKQEVKKQEESEKKQPKKDIK
jgi:hypothetical protein